MFWGLIMEPQRRYTQTVKKAFHISMAALDISSSDNEPTQVMCSFEDRNYLLCTLQKGKIVQCALDLNFEVGDKISFTTNGNSHVHLTGYLVDDFDDAEDDGEEEEEDVLESNASKKRGLKAGGGPAGKKLKTADLLDNINTDDSDDESFSAMMDEDDDIEEEEDQDGEEEEDDDVDGEEEEDEISEDEEESEEEEKPKETPNKKQKLVNGTTPSKKDQKKTPVKKQEQINKSPKQDKTKTPTNEKKGKQEQKTPQQQQQKKRTVEGGVIIEELKQGEGAVAKPGKICQVYYEGRLKNNNKLFDSTNKGPAFKFRLGKQEVIKGWDVGINGMKVGGKRRITCPANMAYGQKGSPPAIPPNATLVFDVELKGVL